MGALSDGFHNEFGIQILDLLLGEVEVVRHEQPAKVIVLETLQIPLVMHRLGGQEAVDLLLDRLIDHLEDLVADVLAVQHLVALLVDDLTLAAEHVVVLQHVLADAEVAAFDLALCALDGVGEHLCLDRRVLVHVQTIHHHGDAFAAEQAHQIVLERDIEAAHARIALTAGTAAQLVVDPAGFMALCADDIQAARRADLLGLLVGDSLVFLVELLKRLACGEDLFVVRLGIAVGLVDQLLGELHAAHLGLGHKLRVAAQLDVGTAARHVRRDRDGALLACLRDDLGFLVVIFRVEHLMLDSALFQQGGKLLGFFDGDRAHENRLSLLMVLDDVFNHGVELAALGLIHHVRLILADHGAVCRDLHNVQLVDLAELLLLGHGRAGHAGELVVQAEEVLEGDGRKRLAFVGDLHALLGLDRLVQAFVVAAAVHEAARELVDDDNLAVLHHIVNVARHDAARLDGLVDVVLDRDVVGVGEIVQLEEGFHLVHAVRGQGGRLGLLVHEVVGVGVNFVVVGLLVQLRHLHHAQSLRAGVGQLIQLG